MMTIGGWILLIVSWGAIVGLTAFCIGMMIKSGKM